MSFIIFYDIQDLDPIREQHPEITELEAKIILLRRNKESYGEIQRLLGNPSKKLIRRTLLKYEPELINNDG